MKIELQDITLTFGKNSVLDNLSLTFEDGNLSTLLGRSGSGKTSILKIIAGILPIKSGKVLFNDQDVTKLKTQQRNVGWVPQQQLIFPGLNVRKNISYGLKARGVSREETETRVNEVAGLIGLKSLLDRDPNGLSGGERQRVAVARALAPQPDILLLDEPFSSLDAPERDRLSLAFKNVQMETGVTTIYVTHAPREAELLADIVFILSEGRILQSGSIEDIQENPNSTEVAKLLNIPNFVVSNEILNISHPSIIPQKAITFDDGSEGIPAKILSVTSTKYFIQVDDVILEYDRTKSMDFTVGQKINLIIDHSALNSI